jgi:hypothetical protein
VHPLASTPTTRASAMGRKTLRVACSFTADSRDSL